MKKGKVVNACLTIDNDVKINIPCEVFLPERITDKPRFVFKTTKKTYPQLFTSWKCKFEASITDLQGNEYKKLICDEVYLKNNTIKQWGSNLVEYHAEGEPENLIIINRLRGGVEKKFIEFWISPNKSITPIEVPFFRGIDNPSQFSPNEISFEFMGQKAKIETRYRQKSLENGDNLEWSYLVVLIEYNKEPDDHESINLIMEQLDEFLCLTSFLTRWRTACLGWSSMNKELMVDFCRGNYTFPTREVKQSKVERLIYNVRPIEIIQDIYKNYQSLVSKDAILQAIYSVIPKDDDLLESSFLSKFSGLESLLLRYKKEENLEHILDIDEWASLKTHLKRSIKNYECSGQGLPKSTRALIYSKLEELNRVSLNETFKSFTMNYNLDLSDLWPLFREKKLAGLSEIRNYLIHGEPIPHKYFKDLSIANQNLTFILERCLCAVLSVPLEKTYISKVKLKAYWEIEDISNEARLNLSRFIVKNNKQRA